MGGGGGVGCAPARRRGGRGGRRGDRAAGEWAVGGLLTRRRGAVGRRDLIGDVLDGLRGDVDSNAVGVFISRIRKKAGAELITTVRGRGYRLGGADRP